MQFASKKTPPEIIAVDTCITNQGDLSAGTNGALGRYNKVTAVPRVNKTANETGKPNQRNLYFCNANKYAAVNARALEMGLVNTVVAVNELEAETVAWAREMLRHSPMALRLLKASLNAADDGLAGVQQLAGDATMLFYLTEEGQEGRNAFKEKREPNFNKFPKRP